MAYGHMVIDNMWPWVAPF